MTNYRGATIRPRTAGQGYYIEEMEKSLVTVAIGPAGTGKTFLAVSYAVSMLKNQMVDRIIITRPVVEAGEKLGFLPGDLKEKVDPYFRPLYDALFEMLGPDKTKRYIERNIIEIAPLAYMRGRTLNNAFILLDEAQNTTRGQMKMFLTRIGENARAVITGDRTQIDLPDKSRSGLSDIDQILTGVEGISLVKLQTRDVVRHPLVKRIIAAYEKYEVEREEQS
jgi:phosphate starvation-inducible PhoH-like protein